MGEHKILDWVKREVQQCHESTTAVKMPIILFDMYWCCMIGFIKNIVKNLGVEVEQIPVECTELIQSVDSGMNNLLKFPMQMKWADWMLDVMLNSDNTSCLQWRWSYMGCRGVLHESSQVNNPKSINDGRQQQAQLMFNFINFFSNIYTLMLKLIKIEKENLH